MQTEKESRVKKRKEKRHTTAVRNCVEDGALHLKLNNPIKKYDDKFSTSPSFSFLLLSQVPSKKQPDTDNRGSQ